MAPTPTGSSTSCCRIARADADVMINPAPSAALEGFGDSSLLFGLYTFVPDPGLSGDVRHRLCTEIQRRFTEEGIVIPYPTHELHVNNRASWFHLVHPNQPVTTVTPPTPIVMTRPRKRHLRHTWPAP